MSTNNIKLVILVALCTLVLTMAAYNMNFGYIVSRDHTVWGAFGDYFGGVLNPIFALCAFIGVLWSLNIQLAQLKQLTTDKQGEEILVVVKDIDIRIVGLLNTQVGMVADTPLGAQSIDLHHMIAEAGRGDEGKRTSAYRQFAAMARLPGSVIESTTRELRSLVIVMHEFLIRYPQSKSGTFAPLVEYYILKNQGVVNLMDDIEPLPPDTQKFFFGFNETVIQK